MVKGIGGSGQEEGKERGCQAAFCNWLGVDNLLL